MGAARFARAFELLVVVGEAIGGATPEDATGAVMRERVNERPQVPLKPLRDHGAVAWLPPHGRYGERLYASVLAVADMKFLERRDRPISGGGREDECGSPPCVLFEVPGRGHRPKRGAGIPAGAFEQTLQQLGLVGRRARRAPPVPRGHWQLVDLEAKAVQTRRSQWRPGRTQPRSRPSPEQHQQERRADQRGDDTRWDLARSPEHAAPDEVG